MSADGRRQGDRDSTSRERGEGAQRARMPRNRRGENPRRVRAGMKLRARDGVIPSTPMSSRWINLLESASTREAIAEGLHYVRLGQIVSLRIESGALRATVQGRAARPYETNLLLEAYSGGQWENITEAMAGEAVYLVKLLAGELPKNMDGLLASLGLSLMPKDPGALRVECSCGAAGTCKHAIAVGYLFAEQLSRDPLLFFTLRGMPADRLLERLRQARAIRARGMAVAHIDPMIPETLEPPPPLEACLEEYWRPSPRLAELRKTPPPQHVSHALLRRLGPSPLNGRFPLVGLLASIYDSVAKYAVKLRDQAERIDDEQGEK